MFPQEISIFLPTPDNHMQNSVFCTDMLFNDKRELPRGRKIKLLQPQILPIHGNFIYFCKQPGSPAGKLSETFCLLHAIIIFNARAKKLFIFRWSMLTRQMMQFRAKVIYVLLFQNLCFQAVVTTKVAVRSIIKIYIQRKMGISFLSEFVYYARDSI